MNRLALSALATLTVLSAARASSAEPDPASEDQPANAPVRSMDEAARKYYERGVARYGAGDYAAAITAFERGQEIDPHPDFLYSLAQAYRKAGECQRARALYQAFLSTNPPDDEATEARLNLGRCVERGAGPWYQYTPGNALAGVGAVGLGIGAAFLVLGESDASDANAATSRSTHDGLASSASRDRQIGAWFTVGGSVVLLGAVAAYALHARSESRTVWLSPRSDGAMIGWGGAL